MSILFLEGVLGETEIESRLLVKIASVFNLKLKNLEDTVDSDRAVWEAKIIKFLYPNLEFLGNSILDDSKRALLLETLIRKYIKNLISESTVTLAVSLMKQFQIKVDFDSDVLEKILGDGLVDLAGEWAKLLGKEKVDLVVRSCREKGHFKSAHKIVQEFKLSQKFPDSFELYRKRYSRTFPPLSRVFQGSFLL